jgi:hypothetical protein
MVAIEKFFDNGEDVLGGYPDCAFLHILKFIVLNKNRSIVRVAKSMPN